MIFARCVWYCCGVIWSARYCCNKALKRSCLDPLKAGAMAGSGVGVGLATTEVAAGAVTTPRAGDRPDDHLARNELGSRIRSALDELSPDHRAVIILREIEGRSYEEISEIVGCSTGTVMSRLFYARKRLQSLLHDVHQSSD